MHTRTSRTVTTPSAPDDARRKAQQVVLAEIVLVVASVQGIAGFATLAKPAFVVHLLFGPDAADGGIAQCFGIAQVALAIACWPHGRRASISGVYGLGVYSAMIALYLTGVRTVIGDGGPLLWPAVFVQALFALLLIWKSSSDGGAHEDARRA
jgi:hypothetical protein